MAVGEYSTALEMRSVAIQEAAAVHAVAVGRHLEGVNAALVDAEEVHLQSCEEYCKERCGAASLTHGGDFKSSWRPYCGKLGTNETVSERMSSAP